MQLNMQKKNHEKTWKELRSTIDVLETILTEKGNKLQEIELSKSDMTKALETKDEERYQLQLNAYQDNATHFKRPNRSVGLHVQTHL
jgi:type II restriction/modification system DNA methylase subunit YeeA